MTDPYDQVMIWYYGLFPPVQCAPPLGVHQGCEHADRPTAHVTIDSTRPDRTDPA